MDARVLGDLALGARVATDRFLQFMPHANILAYSLMLGQAKMFASLGLALSAPVKRQRQPNQDELAARIRAAQAYAQLSRGDMARALETTPATLDRRLRKRAETSELTWQDAWNAAHATGLPEAFFTADFSRLHEITPVEVPLPRGARAAAIQQARDVAQRAGRRPSESPRAAPGTRPGAGGVGTGA